MKDERTGNPAPSSPLRIAMKDFLNSIRECIHTTAFTPLIIEFCLAVSIYIILFVGWAIYRIGGSNDSNLASFISLVFQVLACFMLAIFTLGLGIYTISILMKTLKHDPEIRRKTEERVLYLICIFLVFYFSIVALLFTPFGFAIGWKIYYLIVIFTIGVGCSYALITTPRVTFMFLLKLIGFTILVILIAIPQNLLRAMFGG
jgi:hypothetical protein